MRWGTLRHNTARCRSSSPPTTSLVRRAAHQLHEPRLDRIGVLPHGLHEQIHVAEAALE
jgi:hypothetical protein